MGEAGRVLGELISLLKAHGLTSTLSYIFQSPLTVFKIGKWCLMPGLGVISSEVNLCGGFTLPSSPMAFFIMTRVGLTTIPRAPEWNS